MTLPVFSELKSRFLAYNAIIKWPVFCFIFSFTIGAWLDINGLWSQLPVMVQELPEGIVIETFISHVTRNNIECVNKGWTIPSVLSLSTQMAQIAPILFLIGHKFLPRVFTYAATIYVVLGVGALSCLMLSFFWNKTAYVFGAERSIGLIILNFCLAILDGTSSVTFLPYIAGNFVKEYIIPNYIGESLAAFIPAVIALIQGLGGTPGCFNVTDPKTNETKLEPGTVQPNFSVSNYFIIMFCLLIIATIAFSLLNFLPLSIRARKQNSISNNSNVKNKVQPATSVTDKSIEYDKSTNIFDPSTANSNTELINANEDQTQNRELTVSEKRERVLLMIYVLGLSFICYGVIPGLQSYSTLPYGNMVFNLAVNLSFVFLPISILLSIWSYDVSVLRITIEYTIALGFAVYIIILAALSPCPPLVESGFGGFLSIISWILTQSMFMRIRCLIATRLQRFGQSTMLLYGVATMFGQIFGGIIVFLIVNVYGLLVEKPSCVFDFSYCKK